MCFLNRFFYSITLVFLFLGFASILFAGKSNTLKEEAQKLNRINQEYLDECIASDWRSIYERQHPEFRRRVSIEEFKFYDGMLSFDYRTNFRARVSGGYTLPSIDYIKKNSVKKDMLGYPAVRRYQMTTNPMVRVEKFLIEKVELTANKKFAKITTSYMGKMKLDPSIVRQSINIPFKKEMISYWEQVDNKWYISLLQDVRHISGNKQFHFAPNDESKWKSMEFVSFLASDLTGDKH